MSHTRMCRVAYLVPDMERSLARWGEVLGLSFRRLDLGELPLKVSIDAHGFEALEPGRPALGGVAVPGSNAVPLSQFRIESVSEPTRDRHQPVLASAQFSITG